MGKVAFYLLLTFFDDGQWATRPLTCPDQACVERVVSYGAENSPELYRVRVFRASPFRTNIGDETRGPLIDSPIADYWLQ